MSLRLASRFARREMRGGLRGFRLFLACLALGVAAIAAVGSVRSAIEGGLQREGAALPPHRGRAASLRDGGHRPPPARPSFPPISTCGTTHG